MIAYATIRRLFFSLIAQMLLFCVVVTMSVSCAQAKAKLVTSPMAVDLWVSPTGSDKNPGTQAQPFASVSAAQRDARELRRLGKVGINEPVHIILQSGVYPFTSPLLVRSADSGTEKSPTVFEAAPGAKPVLSGGIDITGWHKATGNIPGMPKAAKGNVWVAAAPRFDGRMLDFRQLWVDGRKAVLAREPNGNVMDHTVIRWNKKKREAWMPSAAVSGIHNVSGVEMIIDQFWEIAILRVKAIRVQGDLACLTFHHPENKVEFERPFPPVRLNAKHQASFYFANAINFLDQPGEWYEDTLTRKVYYWPRPGEDLARVNVVAPALKHIVWITGSLEYPVANVQFKDIAFEYATWMRPSQAGDVPLQDGMYMLDVYALNPPGTSYLPPLGNQIWIGRPPGGISVKDSNHIVFERCRFKHMAAAGLDFQSGTHDDLIEGCVFRDLGGNGIQLGKFSDPGVETHVPYNPEDKRVICAHDKILNNVITDCGTEDWGSVGISIGYARDIDIEHNDLSDLPYTGISVGWGWNSSPFAELWWLHDHSSKGIRWNKLTNCMRNNRIIANYIHHVMTRLRDGAGIYTLSSQPGTIISDNRISDVEHHNAYIYLDEGSSFITVRDNWCSAQIFWKNDNGPGNHWKNNGPLVSQQIKDAAGLEPAFRNLLPE